ncbi:MAG: hypothetical protein ACOY32_10705 [Thermodesulfobacteriota bacterium]
MDGRVLVVVLAAVMMLTWTENGLAKPAKRFDEGTQTCRIFDTNSLWWGKGAKLFQQSCKSCHVRGNDKGAPFLYAESKSPKGWNRVFFKKYPACAQDGSWAGLSPDDLLLVNDYLYRNGANTYDPNSAADCG